MMRLALGLAAAAMLAGAAQAASLDDELIALEKQSWVAWQTHDQAFFARFLSEDHVEMQGNGPAGKAGVVAGVGGACTVKSYQVDHFKVTRFGPDTALVTYRAAQDTTCGSAKVPSPVWATSLFVKRDGRWQNALYVHSPAQ
ncbi:nuclear transport factor 2 family protein [Phenylobacterium sp.]|uniref:nuclear transport factor 2 family protein n=1 Tax=Phenylobacterium sp. TaxID=1871053 RepID=UPI002DE921ED|nr:nuclear transport factor 2 family protein [Phenylobacterium sp.]